MRQNVTLALLLSILSLVLAPLQVEAVTLDEAALAYLQKAHPDIPNPGATAMTCLASHALIPKHPVLAQQLVRRSAEGLLSTLVRDGERVGWTLGSHILPANCGVGTYRPFGRTECNPKETFYAYYNALAILCLRRAGESLNEPKFSEIAEAGAKYWLSIGQFMPDCKECWYFWTSDAQADMGRYVRNISTLMAWAIGETRMRGSRQKIVAVGFAEMQEFKAGNYGYLGRLDPQYQRNPAHESGRTENHAPIVSLALDNIGRLLDKKDLRELSRQLLLKWLICDSEWCKAQTCATHAGGRMDCTNSLASAPCLLRSRAKVFEDNCVKFISRTHSFSTFQLWATHEDQNILNKEQ